MESRVFEQARAKIIWGDSPGEVRRFLLENGIQARSADELITEFMAERVREVRRSALIKLVVGLLTLAVSLVGLYPLWPVMGASYARRRGVGLIYLLLVFGILSGLWKLVDGIIFLARPQAEKRAISELTD